MDQHFIDLIEPPALEESFTFRPSLLTMQTIHFSSEDVKQTLPVNTGIIENSICLVRYFRSKTNQPTSRAKPGKI